MNVLPTKLAKEKKHIFSTCLNLLVILSLVSYPVSASIAMLLKVPSTPINTAYRSIILVLSLVLLLWRVAKSDKKTVPLGFIFFMLFWVVYSLILYHDVTILGIRYGDYDANYVYSFAFAVCFIPAFTILANLKYIRLKELSKGLFNMTIISNVFIFILLMRMLADGTFDPTKLRADVGLEGQGSTINPITIGFYGEILSLFILAKIFIARGTKNYFTLLPLLGLGLTNLLLGA
jgi:hypothetical protein